MANINVLLQELTEATERGSVSWEETAQEDTFLATLKSASLRIEMRSRIIGESIKMEIRDVEGKLIERVSADWSESERPPSLASGLKRLHLSARRKARDTDSKIESLLSELQAS